MIKVKNLVKRYKQSCALNDVNLRIPNGVFGLIGENGAGKSTLLRILATLDYYDEGQIIIDDFDIRENREIVRQMIGYLPQNFDFFPNLTVVEAMEYLAVLKGIAGDRMRENILYWLDKVHLLHEKDIKIKRLTQGMKQRFGIAQAFMGEPRLIILDEPTAWLDPKECLYVHNLFNEKKEDRTIMISTRMVSDILSSCEYLSVIQEGNISFQGTLYDLLNSVRGYIYTVRVEQGESEHLLQRFRVISMKRKDDWIEFRFIAVQEELGEYASLCTEVDSTAEDAYFFHAGLWLKYEGGPSR